MKILHVYKTYYPDDVTGVPRFIHTLAESTYKRGFHHEVLAPSAHPSKNAIKISNHKVFQVKQNFRISSTSISLSILSKFKSLSSDADVVHYHFPWPIADIMHLVSGISKPSVLTYHSDIVRQRRHMWLYNPLMNAFLDRMDAIVATSPAYRQTSCVLQKRLLQTQVIPIGLPERQDVPAGILSAMRAKVGEGFILFVGALRYYKGINYLLQAARATKLPLVIAGKNQDLRLDLRSLPENIVYLGEVTEMEKEALLTLCSGFVLPSHVRSEAFGIALVEAARAGKPMISCEIGTGTSFVNAHGETGIVVPPADSKALADAMRRLLSDRILRQKMGTSARRRFLQRFHAGVMAQNYTEVYHQVCERAAQRA
ncbi:glycosyltransferase [Nitratireductor basaltis]|uniref:Glycosyl transferase group 1 protein n=1 Tax=Nitratireductor basaltis TaxID=472175 RepID=A0A084UD10_9HYPH|nr:glycosyltransferase [Nitratireductor basaltis]KFB10846.1 Glycosyl transferase group 1 protein [Nitratireductor basaltis]